MMNKYKIKLYPVFLFSLLSITLFSCSTTGPVKDKFPENKKSSVDAVLTHMPAQNSGEETNNNNLIIQQGQEGIKYICSLLVPPGTGDDTSARFALSGLASYVHRPGTESERIKFSTAVLDALNSAKNKEVKAFLIRMLQQAGKNEAVKPLGLYLTDEILCGPAAAALYSIGTTSAAEELIKKLAEMKGGNLITVIKIIGDLKYKPAVSRLMKYSVCEDEGVRDAVFYALANIGPYTTEAVLNEAVKNAANYKKTEYTSYSLLYAKRLAEAGMNFQSAGICRDLLKNRSLSGDNKIYSAALKILVDAVGEDALPDLLAAVNSQEKDIRIAALNLACCIPGTGVTKKWINKMKSAAPDVKMEIAEMLKKRGDKTAHTAVLEAEGFVPLFNGKDLSGWKGLVGDPLARAKMNPAELKKAQKEADKKMREHWKVVDGTLVFDGHGSHLCTVRDYGDFEMAVDWKIGPKGDSGIYLRGSPQVQIWDPAQWPEGSGGLYNNQMNPRKPLKPVDNPIGEWNNFRIKMTGERVTVYLNDVLIVNNVLMENYWDRNQPMFPTGQIELQSHGSELFFKNVYIREIPMEKEFKTLFNGKDLTGWTGSINGYSVADGAIVCNKDGGGNLYTEDEYSDFILRFEFKLTPGANNGLGIRAPLKGDAAYAGMELQILDNSAEKYKDLNPYQFHGSVYGVVPALRGHQKEVGKWNFQEVTAKGNRIIVNLNGVNIVDADIEKAAKPETIDKRDHPGLKRKTGHIGFLGHGAHVEFRNIRIMKLK